MRETDKEILCIMTCVDKKTYGFFFDFILTTMPDRYNILYRIYSICEVDELEQIYIDISRILKAISDPKRLRIVDMLSCGELPACRILEAFHITQPTLSHDMKVLIEAKVVNDKRDGKMTYYSLNKEFIDAFEHTLHEVLTPKANCICQTVDGCDLE